MKKVAIIILNYRSSPITKKCIESLNKYETYPFTIFLVNNDPEINITKKYFTSKNMQIINTKKNLGFAKGVNRGITKALKHEYEYIFLLNNDATLKGPVLSRLSQTLIAQPAGIVAPALLFYKGKQKLFDLGGKINPILLRTTHTEVKKITSKVPLQVQYVTGGAMFIKNEVFTKIGIFDERFFLYYEDADFCLRAKKAGFSIFVDPTVTIYHSLSSTIGKGSFLATYNLVKGAILFGRKYAQSPLIRITNTLFVLFQSALFFIKFPHGRKAVLQALREYLVI